MGSCAIETSMENNENLIKVCECCKLNFTPQQGYEIHSKKDSFIWEGSFKCQVCLETRRRKSPQKNLNIIHQTIYPSIKENVQNKIISLETSVKELESIWLTCSHCPKKFPDQKSLDAHECSVHFRAKTFACSFCPTRFQTLLLRQQHEAVHTKDFNHQWNSCLGAFKNTETSQKHLIIHPIKKSFNCPICSEEFSQKFMLQEHLGAHLQGEESNQIPYFEEHDGKSDLLNKPVHKNERTEKSEENLTPKETNVEELDLSDLTTLCDVAISTSDSFFSSTANHILENNEFCCLFCGMRYLQKKFFNFHLASIHFVCVSCNTKHVDKVALDQHVCSKKYPTKELSKVKRAMLNFPCDMCSKSFNSRNGFLIHQRSHTGERPFQCRFCIKAFGDSATRHKHERIHTGERPFKCSNCSRAFNQRAALRAHETTHKCQRPFPCSYCLASFSYLTSLRKHTEAQHSDTLQLTCPTCDDVFVDSNSLLGHVRSAHKTEIPVCNLCDLTCFSNTDQFYLHSVWHAKQQALNLRFTPKTKQKKRSHKTKK